MKACAPLAVTSLGFTASGNIQGDREWVVVDADDRITWSGAIPTLWQLKPIGTRERMAIASAAGDSVPLPAPAEGAPRIVYLWNASRQAFDSVPGQDAGDTAAEFASAIAGQKVRLVHLSTGAHRPNAVHVVTDASLQVLAAKFGANTDLLRFRPNLVLADDRDPLPPFAEEHAATLMCRGANHRLDLMVTGPCERCIVVNVDPGSSAVDGRYLKGVVEQSRARRTAAAPIFGVYARARTAGVVAIGDEVEILAQATN